MSDIRLDVDYRELEELREMIKHIPFAIARAQKMATRKALDAMRPEAVRQSRNIYHVKAAAVRKAIRLYPSQMLVQGTRLSLSEFKLSPRQIPKRPHGLRVAVKRIGGMKNIPRGFLIRGRNSGKILPFMRTGKAREDIKQLFSPAVPQMMEDIDVQTAILERGEEVFMNTFRYWAQRALTEWASLSNKDYTSGGHIFLPGAKSADVTGWH